MDGFNTISGVYEYDFDIPTGTEVHQILYMTYDGQDIPHKPKKFRVKLSRLER